MNYLLHIAYCLVPVAYPWHHCHEADRPEFLPLAGGPWDGDWPPDDAPGDGGRTPAKDFIYIYIYIILYWDGCVG